MSQQQARRIQARVWKTSIKYPLPILHIPIKYLHLLDSPTGLANPTKKNILDRVAVIDDSYHGYRVDGTQWTDESKDFIVDYNYKLNLFR
jgi:hypothetical protein